MTLITKTLMNKKIVASATCAITLILCSHAWAEGGTNAEKKVKHGKLYGVFLGGAGGLGGMRTPSTAVPNNSTTSSSETIGYGFIYHLFVGYLFRQDKKWQPGFSLGFEGYPNNEYSYIYHDTSTSGTETSSLIYSGYDFPLIGILKLQWQSHASLNFLAGISYVIQKNTFSFSSTINSSSANSPNNLNIIDGFKPLIGLGIEYRYRNFGISSSFRHRFGTRPKAFHLHYGNATFDTYDGYNKIPSTNNLMLNLLYYFK